MNILAKVVIATFTAQSLLGLVVLINFLRDIRQELRQLRPQALKRQADPKSPTS